ncbi:WG repeat-containing protein [Chryseobacterium luteum]|nr:WG repeat-containing protein [Chryseobacterium luteum]
MGNDKKDPEFKKGHNFIRNYLGKDHVYSDKEIQEEEKAKLEKWFDYKFILDLDFCEYLKSVSVEDHRSDNFSAVYPVTVKNDLQALYFKNREHPFSVLPEYADSLYQVNFDINLISKSYDELFAKTYHHLTGVMDSKNKSILILPFFNEVKYYKDFSVFCCSMFPDNEEDLNNFTRRLFYFDTKGRFIKEEKGYLPNGIPTIAFNEQDNSFTEISVPYAEKIHSHTLYTIEKEDGFSLVNHRNEPLIDGIYQKIFVSDSLDSAITPYENDIFLHSFRDKSKIKLAEGQTVDQKNSLIRFFDVHKKWGILNHQAIETEPGYDYLDWTYDQTKFRAFKGDFSWNYVDNFEELIGTKITSHNPDLYTSYGKKLENGKWGIINLQSEILIPFEYEWIEELNENLYLANKNGDVYRFDLYHEYSEWKKPEVDYDEHVVTGGEWYILDLQGNILKKLNIKELEELYRSDFTEDSEAFNQNKGIQAYKL